MMCLFLECLSCWMRERFNDWVFELLIVWNLIVCNCRVVHWFVFLCVVVCLLCVFSCVWVWVCMHCFHMTHYEQMFNMKTMHTHLHKTTQENTHSKQTTTHKKTNQWTTRQLHTIKFQTISSSNTQSLNRSRIQQLKHSRNKHIILINKHKQSSIEQFKHSNYQHNKALP
jgi:hypothetical protein